MKTPCENAIWEIIPLIRKEIVCCMINNFGLNQEEAAKKLDISSAVNHC